VTCCSLLELQRQNDELTRQNDIKDQEIERMSKALKESLAFNKLTAAYKKIQALEATIMNVRVVLIQHDSDINVDANVSVT